MKTKSFLSTLIIIMLSTSIISCDKSIDEVPEGMELAPKKKVGVVTRSASTIEYPITLYAFNAAGNLVQSVTAEEEEDALEMELAVGSYHLVAMAGTSGLDEVESPAIDSSIGIPEEGIIKSAVQMGHADIDIPSTELASGIEITLTLKYQVAQVYVELQDIPIDVNAASVTLSSVYSDKTFRGALSGSKTVTIPLIKKSETDNTTWCSTTLYTLPGLEDTPLTLNINLTNDTKTKVYSYTHDSNLQAATPYNLVGSFKNGFNLTGTITAEGWNETENITFTFGMGAGEDNPATPDITPEDTPSDTPDDGPISVTEIPEVKTIWDGHFVANVTNNDDGSADLLLMSLAEWDIAREDIESEAVSHTNSFVENAMNDWRIPTSEELIDIFPTFATSSEIEKVNRVLVNEGKGVKLTNSAPYLCNEATQYVLLSSSPMAMNLVSSQNYHLRLVKTVTVVISE